MSEKKKLRELSSDAKAALIFGIGFGLVDLFVMIVILLW